MASCPSPEEKIRERGSPQYFGIRLESEDHMEETTTRQINFREEVVPLKGLEVDKVCPITGKIKSVTMSFPPGCNNLVEVAFGHSEQKVCPSTEYIALDSANPTFDGIEEPVEREERLWVEILNGDDTYPHTISVLVVITGKLGGE